MKIISSQKYFNNEIVLAKMAELENEKSVTLPVAEVGFDDLFVLVDGHHRLIAAQELGIEVKFEITLHGDGLTGEDLLEQTWIDSDWYDIKTGNSIF
jgi:hypothetical protein